MEHLSWTGLNKLFVVGINFQKADVSRRNRFAVTQDQVQQLYTTEIALGFPFFVLSTCNRTEIYGMVPCEYILLHALKSVCAGSSEEIREFGYVKVQDEAVEHLLTVASGLDSQIPGDYEIISQIKTAFQIAKDYQKTSGYLERLVNQALQVSKIVKNTTTFSNGTLSVSYAVIQQIKKINAISPRICVIGLGAMGLLTIRNIKAYLPGARLVVVNRDEEKLRKLSEDLSIQTFPLSDLKSAMSISDFVIVCTTAPQPLILLSHVAGSHIMTIFDLSIPQNVSPEVYANPAVQVMDVDSVSQEINKTVNGRLAEVPKVRRVVKEKSREFIEWAGKRDFVSLMNGIQLKLESKPSLSNKDLSEAYGQQAEKYLAEPGNRKALLMSLCIHSFSDRKNEVRQIMASIENEVYASDLTNYNPGKPSCFMADQCCNRRGQTAGTSVHHHSN
jgi:glutamyl-tRNA reductase